ncbi:DUF4232 domain-containing protein [Streptomyces sp. NRRL B-1677]|uniref:DUF4232 domain-containing protein n=1 Tax=Streptomyces TaxID=1883 RepID=UPI001892A3E6|nr:DUF4232 domain-containing protein [Streptomyces sp. NRRL B-1677]MBF6049077.1 DUF4232 domain-containing protein [Streptomyces sp. NRRL B-1677]
MKHHHIAAALALTAAFALTACGSEKPQQTTASPSTEAMEDNKPQAKGDACAPSDMKVEARSQAGKLLLVATNTARQPCTAYGFPYVRFDQDQATTGVGEETKPKEPTKVAPGKSAYAAITPTAADGSGGPGRDAKKISVTFQTPTGDPMQRTPATPALPGNTLHVDDQARATYWLPDEGAALKG